MGCLEHAHLLREFCALFRASMTSPTARPGRLRARTPTATAMATTTMGRIETQVPPRTLVAGAAAVAAAAVGNRRARTLSPSHRSLRSDREHCACLHPLPPHTSKNHTCASTNPDVRACGSIGWLTGLLRRCVCADHRCGGREAGHRASSGRGEQTDKPAPCEPRATTLRLPSTTCVPKSTKESL